MYYPIPIQVIEAFTSEINEKRLINNLDELTLDFILNLRNKMGDELLLSFLIENS